jgi:hypothetical protein
MLANLADGKAVTMSSLGHRLPVPGTLSAVIVKKPKVEKDDLKAAIAALQKLLHPVKSADVDKETAYDQANPAKISTVEKPYLVTEWASGGGDPAFKLTDAVWRFIDGANATFFQGLFDVVAKTIPGAEYNRTNLFHGHVVYAREGEAPDLGVVFHAYEYPEDLEPGKAALAKTLPDFQGFKGALTDDQAFYKKFCQRNAIWTLADNALRVPDYYEYVISLDEDDIAAGWGKLIQDKTGGITRGVTVDEAKVGTNLIGLNYFPKEKVGLFLKQN